MNRKVLFISYDGMTDPLGQSQVIPYLRELTKLGHRFTILSVEKKDRLEKHGEQIRAMLQEYGIDWMTIPFSTRPPFLSKVYDQRKLTRTAERLHKQKKFDLVHCRSYVAASTGLYLWKKFELPFLFDMRGFWVDERVDSGLWNLKNPFYRFFYKVYKKKERAYFHSASMIISLTHKGKLELITAYNVKKEKIAVIPCCADLDHFNYNNISASTRDTIRTKLAINESQQVISYLGSLGGWYMTDEMLDFFAVMKQQFTSAVFLFITHDKPEGIIAKAAGRGIAADSLRIVPASRNDVPNYLSVSDWSIFFIKDLYSKKASSPTKQAETMGMGIPIICNDIGDTGSILTKTQTGLVINEFTGEGYASATATLDALLSIDQSKIRQAAFDHYDLKVGVAEYNNVYSNI